MLTSGASRLKPGHVVDITTSICLPFLYQTRTLQDAVQRLGKRSALQRHFHAASRSNLSSPYPANDESSERNTLDFHQFKRFPNTRARRSAGRSTVTSSEQAVFDKIFSDLTEHLQSDRRDESTKFSFEEDKDLTLTPYARLSSILSTAIKEQVGTSQKAPRVQESSETENEHVVEADAESSSSSDPRESNLELRQAASKHKTSVVEQIENAQSDVEIWKVLERDVFKLIPQVEKYQNIEEKARKIPAEENRSKKRTFSGDLENQSRREKVPQRKKDLGTDTLAYIAQKNYDYYCLRALRTYRNRFPFTPYALYLLHHIKSLGPVSQVLGASTNLYNEVIYQRWVQSNDINGIANTLQEMNNQGLEPNYATWQLLRYVLREHQSAMIGDKGEVVKIWSRMHGRKTGWMRVRNAFLEWSQKMVDEGKDPTFRRLAMSEDSESDRQSLSFPQTDASEDLEADDPASGHTEALEDEQLDEDDSVFKRIREEDY